MKHDAEGQKSRTTGNRAIDETASREERKVRCACSDCEAPVESGQPAKVILYLYIRDDISKADADLMVGG